MEILRYSDDRTGNLGLKPFQLVDELLKYDGEQADARSDEYRDESLLENFLKSLWLLHGGD